MGEFKKDLQGIFYLIKRKLLPIKRVNIKYIDPISSSKVSLTAGFELTFNCDRYILRQRFFDDAKKN